MPMKVLWVCNMMLPVIAEHLGLEASNKEGWLAGLCGEVLKRQQDNGIELHVAFPVELERDGYCEKIETEDGNLVCHGFYEDTAHAEQYEEGLEERLKNIVDAVNPDVVHCFGTEYAHTLAVCRVVPDKSKLLIGIQGVCEACANAYFANMPEKVINRVTLRDLLRQDSIRQQYEKFVQRGKREKEAVQLAGNVTGRTALDEHYTKEWNPEAKYYSMNETLRSNFYQGAWEKDKCIPYSIFVSQGDYPIKGFHYMLLALPRIKEKYPDVKVYVAGNSIVGAGWKGKLKISSYGKYISEIIRKENLGQNIEFLGRLNAEQMRERYLKSHLYVCCSTMENSPNSLGEAMLLGVPCVSADVGGITSMFDDGKDGILYRGFRTTQSSFDGICDAGQGEDEDVQKSADRLADSVLEMWSNEEKMLFYCENARKHAKKTHNGEENYRKLMQIYEEIASNGGI